MKSGTHIDNSLLVNQVQNLCYSERQIQSAVNTSRPQEIASGRKVRLAHSVKQSEENPGKLEKTKLYIKNMVTIRCKMVVRAVLENLGLNYSTVELGEVEIIGNLSDMKYEQLKSDLLKCGLELMEDKKNILVEKIKKVVIETIHYSDQLPEINFSEYLSEKLDHNYTYLANLFSEVKGMSIQHFIILHKI